MDIPVALAGRPLCEDYGGSQYRYEEDLETRSHAGNRMILTSMNVNRMTTSDLGTSSLVSTLWVIVFGSFLRNDFGKDGVPFDSAKGRLYLIGTPFMSIPLYAWSSQRVMLNLLEVSLY